MLFIIFIIIIVIYMNNQKKVYNKTSNKKTYTYPDKSKKRIEPNVRDLSSKKVVINENFNNKKKKTKDFKKGTTKLNVSKNSVKSNTKKELVIEEVKDTLDENDDVKVENSKSNFKFNPKEAFIYSEIFNRKY